MSTPVDMGPPNELALQQTEAGRRHERFCAVCNWRMGIQCADYAALMMRFTRPTGQEGAR